MAQFEDHSVPAGSNSFEMRVKVLAEVRSWLGTPFHHAQATKGRGVDCAMLLCSVYEAVGVLPHIDPRPYPPDWHLHRDAEKFMQYLRQYARRVDRPQAADIALFRYGRCASHGAIVEDDEYMIHAWTEAHAVVRTERRALADRLDSYWSVIP